MENRYFLDVRSGCAAVRDRKHPKYDESYPGLHHDTPDVVEYRHGTRGDDSWVMDTGDIEHLRTLCDELNEFSTPLLDTEKTYSEEDMYRAFTHFARKPVSEHPYDKKELDYQFKQWITDMKSI